MLNGKLPKGIKEKLELSIDNIVCRELQACYEIALNGVLKVGHNTYHRDVLGYRLADIATLVGFKEWDLEDIEEEE